jgi:hypothetical protein
MTAIIPSLTTTIQISPAQHRALCEKAKQQNLSEREALAYAIKLYLAQPTEAQLSVE